jgi:hypothetical protein
MLLLGFLLSVLCPADTGPVCLSFLLLFLWLTFGRSKSLNLLKAVCLWLLNFEKDLTLDLPKVNPEKYKKTQTNMNLITARGKKQHLKAAIMETTARLVMVVAVADLTSKINEFGSNKLMGSLV